MRERKTAFTNQKRKKLHSFLKIIFVNDFFLLNCRDRNQVHIHFFPYFSTLMIDTHLYFVFAKKTKYFEAFMTSLEAIYKSRRAKEFDRSGM